jgi:hypothetical protein
VPQDAKKQPYVHTLYSEVPSRIDSHKVAPNPRVPKQGLYLEIRACYTSFTPDPLRLTISYCKAQLLNPQMSPEYDTQCLSSIPFTSVYFRLC